MRSTIGISVAVWLALGCGGEDRVRGADAGGGGDGGSARDAGGSDASAADAGAIATSELTMCWEAVATGGDGQFDDVAHAGSTVVVGGDFAGSFDLGDATYTTTAERAGVLVALDAASGSVVWSELYDTAGRASVSAVDIDAGGDVFVAIVADDGLMIGPDAFPAGLTVARLAAATREPIWAQTFTPTGSMVVDFGEVSDDGRMVIAGRFGGRLPVGTTELAAGGGTAGPDGFAIALEAATGAVAWAVAFGGGGGFDDVQAATFGDGDLWLTGSSRSDGSVDSRLYVQRLDGSTGATVWRQRFVPDAGMGRREAWGSAIAWTPEGVLVTGPIRTDANVGAGSMAVPDGDTAFAGLYAAADGAAVRIATFREGAGGVLRAALGLGDGAVLAYERSTFLVIDVGSLEPTERRTFMTDLPLFEASAVRTTDRVYLSGRMGNVIGSLDPGVVCLEL